MTDSVGVTLKLPPPFYWDFSLFGDPLPSLVSFPMPTSCAVGVYATSLRSVVCDGHGEEWIPVASMIVRKAQQNLHALYGITDPRVHGFICEEGDEPSAMVVIDCNTGGATVMPRAKALEFLRSANPRGVLPPRSKA